jgi:hypothetical protein
LNDLGREDGMASSLKTSVLRCKNIHVRGDNGWRRTEHQKGVGTFSLPMTVRAARPSSTPKFD